MEEKELQEQQQGRERECSESVTYPPSYQSPIAGPVDVESPVLDSSTGKPVEKYSEQEGGQIGRMELQGSQAAHAELPENVTRHEMP
jgi:hypothetical protein